MDQIEYHPPRNEVERRLVRSYRIMKRVFGLLLCASLVVLEYHAVLRLGSNINMIVTATIAVLFAVSLAQSERFQSRSPGIWSLEAGTHPLADL